MAWSFVKLKQLAFRFSNGHEDVTITNVNPTDSNSTMNGIIAANPYQYGDRLLARYNTEGAAAVDTLYAFSVGTIDVYGGLYDLLSGTEYMDLYNPIAGHDAGFIRFTRANNNYYSYDVKAWFNGQSASMYGPASASWQSTYVRTQDVPRRPQCGISFLVDDFGMVLYCATKSEPTWSNKNLGYKNVYFDFAGRMNNMIIQNVCRVLLNLNIQPEVTPSVNPYSDGSFSEPSGTPTGDYDDTSDVISLPSAPSFNLVNTGLIKVWVPDAAGIDSLAAYLWANFDLTDSTKTLSKLFTDPLSYILSVHMLPFEVPHGSTPVTVTLGGYATTVQLPLASAQYKDIDCGSVTINEYWGNYLDYTYTKIVLCLPFCGQVDLDPDEVMGKTIKVLYRVDVITGAFVCFVYIDSDKVLGQYAGNCASQIPISAADFSRLNAAVLGVAGAAASAFGAAALGGHGGMLNGASGGLISSIAANAQNAKVRAQHSGGLTGAPGFMGIQKPYLIIHRPRQSVPEDYEQYRGYPSNVTMVLSDCSGFTSVREIKLDGLPFTDGELTELKSILEGGIII